MVNKPVALFNSMRILIAVILAILEKILTVFLIIIPEEYALYLGARFGDLLFFLVKFTPYRNYLTNNVDLTFGDRFNEQEKGCIARQGLEKIGKSLVEVFRFPLLNKGNLHKKVTIRGRENLDKALEKGKGIILVSGHFGNWELAGAAITLSGYRLATVIQDQSNPTANSFLNHRRKSKGIKIISRYADLRVLIKMLRENYIVGMIADQHGESLKVFGTFFGHRVSLQEGPGVLFALIGSPVVPVFIIRNRDDSHDIIIEKEICLDDIQEISREEKIAAVSQRVSNVLEKYISLYPDHWNWMYNRWDKLNIQKGIK
ncbi:hypothetical protein COY52_00095 [Candidatus Desantisbacteria bacterium CG_4_10_14_0_8_um_filter_48_22]|uniref:Lipid A biosynthesis acyltransferase n=1 Tax=Candidatus Desantisbacteria bacterium CG_4_10_14_0_8_um_filter_48_22 TaxID=1974543 RepID=A0A2M7SG93_9BACT|nr:MAG: hypothetical protein AUJ67_01125 [Candidatus Desantisbacteria bacterium CG1_02_49_89]PIV56594.1 MAG: hypothetical protein COS16_03455 [Candidatus Desantisbacteria bacterium CG02_land_8_20_14_3_00_49_13]PIZ18313.1 MAG: hypothetical protein COY52_00095 [Candidatus Desantisbacteria bacterium CG_4_10_14_0_8_um_filter_48_22]